MNRRYTILTVAGAIFGALLLPPILAASDRLAGSLAFARLAVRDAR